MYVCTVCSGGLESTKTCIEMYGIALHDDLFEPCMIKRKYGAALNEQKLQMMLFDKNGVELVRKLT